MTAKLINTLTWLMFCGLLVAICLAVPWWVFVIAAPAVAAIMALTSFGLIEVWTERPFSICVHDAPPGSINALGQPDQADAPCDLHTRLDPDCPFCRLKDEPFRMIEPVHGERIEGRTILPK